jgi:VanZ family protein
MDTRINWKRNFIILFFFLITLSIFYFSWIPDSHFKSETYLPLWLRNWSNSYYNLRTAIPFIAFGFFLAASFSSKPQSKKKNSILIWFWYSIIAFAVACLAEVGQFFILNRHPDIMDVCFAIVGSQLGFLIYFLFVKIINLSVFKSL